MPSWPATSTNRSTTPASRDYNLAIPTVEHYYPLLVALGAADKKDKVEVFNEYRELGSMSMTSYAFGKD